MPGGSVEVGEDLVDAVAREVWEETRLVVEVGEEVWVAIVPLSPDADYEIHAFRAVMVGGILEAGDDAADATWVGPQEFQNFPTTPRLGELLEQAGWPQA